MIPFSLSTGMMRKDQERKTGENDGVRDGGKDKEVGWITCSALFPILKEVHWRVVFQEYINMAVKAHP